MKQFIKQFKVGENRLLLLILKAAFWLKIPIQDPAIKYHIFQLCLINNILMHVFNNGFYFFTPVLDTKKIQQNSSKLTKLDFNFIRMLNK